MRPIDEPQCTRDGLCHACLDRGVDRCFPDRQKEMRWFVLNPGGKTMSEVIVAGPFENKSLATAAVRDVRHHVERLRLGPVERALDEERCLQQSLRFGVAVKRRTR